MKTALILVNMVISPVVNAEVISFADVWAKIKQNSPSIAREGHALQASTFAKSRLALHWLPSLSLGAAAFSTNDPAVHFVSTLAQRQISLGDFSPASLNQPGNHLLETAALGIDVPLFQGGLKVAQFEAQNKMQEAQSYKQKTELLREFVDAALSYTSLLSYSVAEERLSALAAQVADLITRYSIGRKSNPVGYSGLLGLKSLKNRIAGEQLSFQSKNRSIKGTLSEKMQINNQEWSPTPDNAIVFLERTVSPKSEAQPSLVELHHQAQADAVAAMKNAEKARFLPKVGLFATEGLTHGERDTGTSFTGGLYLQWSLFNPENINQVSEKEELRLVAFSDVAADKQSSRIAKKTLQLSEVTLKENLVLLAESEALLAEQAKVASQLFRTGSISALQLAEVLNRRVDLILNLLTSEQDLIEVRGKRMMLSNPEGVN